jgi:hypothetical protein
MKRRDFLTTVALTSVGLLATIKAGAKTPNPPLPELSWPKRRLVGFPAPTAHKPELTLVYYAMPFVSSHFIAAQYDRYRKELGLDPINPCNTYYHPHHSIEGQSNWIDLGNAIHKRLERMNDTNMTGGIITFAGMPKNKPSFAHFPNEWLRMADNAFIIDRDGVRVVKDRYDKFRDLTWDTHTGC